MKLINLRRATWPQCPGTRIIRAMSRPKRSIHPAKPNKMKPPPSRSRKMSLTPSPARNRAHRERAAPGSKNRSGRARDPRRDGTRGVRSQCRQSLSFAAGADPERPVCDPGRRQPDAGPEPDFGRRASGARLRRIAERPIMSSNQRSRDKTDPARAPENVSDAEERHHSNRSDQAGGTVAGDPSVETDQLHALTSSEPAGSSPSSRHLTVDADDLGDIMPGANDEDQ
jgi:hypothetical protein